MPSGTTPWLCSDANARLGISKDGKCFPPHVGTCNEAQENSNGVLLRELLVNCNLVATNTHKINTDTFCSVSLQGVSSRIDYICCPVCFEKGSAGAADVVAYDGRKLQLARSSRPIDHTPVVQSFRCHDLLLYSPPAKTIIWDKDLLVRSLTHGVGRQDFCQAGFCLFAERTGVGRGFQFYVLH